MLKNKTMFNSLRLFQNELTNLVNQYGIDRLSITIKALPVFTSEPENFETELEKFISFVEAEMKREMTTHEIANFYTGVYNYLESDPATDKRMDAMNYIFDFKFLENNNLGQPK